MSRIGWMTVVLIMTLALLPVVGIAAEHGGKELGAAASTQSTDAKTPAKTTASAGITPAPAAPAPVSTAPATPAAPPALKPIVITFSGELSAMDTKGTPAMIKVKDRYGVEKEIACPTEAKISPEGKGLADLKVGDKLTVEYTYDVTTGKRSAQVVTIGEAAAAPAANQ